MQWQIPEVVPIRHQSQAALLASRREVDDLRRQRIAVDREHLSAVTRGQKQMIPPDAAAAQSLPPLNFSEPARDIPLDIGELIRRGIVAHDGRITHRQQEDVLSDLPRTSKALRTHDGMRQRDASFHTVLRHHEDITPIVRNHIDLIADGIGFPVVASRGVVRQVARILVMVVLPRRMIQLVVERHIPLREIPLQRGAHRLIDDSAAPIVRTRQLMDDVVQDEYGFPCHAKKRCDTRARIADIGIAPSDGRLDLRRLIENTEILCEERLPQPLVFCDKGLPHGLQRRAHQRMRAPEQANILPPCKEPEHIPHLLEEALCVLQHTTKAGVIKIDLPPCHLLPPPCGRLRWLLAQADHAVEFRRSETDDLLERHPLVKEMPQALRLNDDVVRICIDRAERLPLPHSAGRRVIRHIHHQLRISSQSRRIILRRDGRNEVCLIVGIVDIDNIRPQLREIHIPIVDDGYILGEILALIMHLPQRIIGVPVIIGNRHHIRLARLILSRRPPDALEAVPHRGLIGEEYDELFDFVFLTKRIDTGNEDFFHETACLHLIYP